MYKRQLAVAALGAENAHLRRELALRSVGLNADGREPWSPRLAILVEHLVASELRTRSRQADAHKVADGEREALLAVRRTLREARRGRAAAAAPPDGDVPVLTRMAETHAFRLGAAEAELSALRAERARRLEEAMAAFCLIVYPGNGQAPRLASRHATSWGGGPATSLSLIHI